ncbi:unnamed protein product [Phytomonas sp. EM1]|nr:unnamed protein product [Phytomonas sp. EM1]|eukprot:CCW59935.1 unnamed protein product [Phytomonas sp. isolate EM1]
MSRRFITCPLCGRGYGSASINIHIPQCYEKALKRWKVDPIGPRPVMPPLNGCKNMTTFSGGPKFGDEQPCGSGPNAARSLRTNLEQGEFSCENANLHACSKCGRRFIFDRIGYHESVCKGNMKRRVFDSSKQRRTDDEGFGAGSGNVSWGKRNQKKKTEVSKSVGISGSQKISTWRQQHEEFIQAIRGARKADAQLRQMWGVKEFNQEPFPVSHSGATSLSRRAGVPASMIRQSTTRKSIMARGGKAGWEGPSFHRTPPPNADAFQPSIRNQNSWRPPPRATSRGDCHRGAGGGGFGSGGVQIANTNATSLGMLQAFGRA